MNDATPGWILLLLGLGLATAAVPDVGAQTLLESKPWLQRLTTLELELDELMSAGEIPHLGRGEV